MNKDKNEQGYHAYFKNNKKANFTLNELANILRKNTLLNNRYVILNTLDFDNEKSFLKTKLNLNNSINGNITHSKGIFFKIDRFKKIINIKQSTPKDWILFKNINFKNWTINFNGKINNLNNKDSSQRFNNNGLTGCLNFFNTIFDNTSIKMNNGYCEDSVNIVNSNGKIKSVYINDAFSDALDLDFSKLTIDHLFIFNSGIAFTVTV